MQKTSHYWPQCAKWFSRYSISKSGIWARWISPFCRFSALFSIKYDVTDAILQDNEKWKCNISGVFFLICLKLCRLLELGKGILLHFKFCCYGKQNQNYCLSLKKQKIYCLSKSLSIFHALSFKLNFFFDRRFPLIKLDILIKGIKIIVLHSASLCFKLFPKRSMKKWPTATPWLSYQVEILSKCD